MTWITAQPPFKMPEGLPWEQQVAFCVSIINRYRRELPEIRAKSTRLQEKTKTLEKEVRYWKEKYEEEKKEKEKLKEEIEKLLKTKNRYQVALFDHGNFTRPNASKKVKGGQIGHSNTNREAYEKYHTYEKRRLFAKVCGNCQTTLPRVKAVKQKVLLDIIINPQITKFLLQSERQWCSSCQKEVNAKDSRSLPFTEYGINTFMMILLLRFKAHCSLKNIVTIIEVTNGLTLAKSDAANLLRKASGYLGKRYEELKKAVRQGNVLYADETGWLVHGQKAWMWIMSNEEATVYVAAESRGKGIAATLYGESDAYAMTDGLKSYTNTIPQEKHLYCWAHMLRFAFEETVHSQEHSQAIFLRDELVRIYQIKRMHPDYTKERLATVVKEALMKLLAAPADETAYRAIARRLFEQKEGLIRALLITESGTNNLAERELRNMAIKRTISHGSDTYQGMETTAVIGSVLQTLQRNKHLPFFPTLQMYVLAGIQDKNKQYVHTAYYDS